MNEEIRQRTKWFMEDRFGMFIHWGLYSIPACGEWMMSQKEMTIEEYSKYFDQFDPVDYDPKKWVRLAKKAGMKYVVLTAKHHDGFCLFDSKLTDYKSTNTKAGRDLVREFVDACREEGLKVGLYFSIIDWHHPDFPKYGDRQHPMRNNPAYKDEKIDFDRYLAYMHGQIKELVTGYGKLDLLWFDFSYDDMTGEKWKATELIKMVRKYQPDKSYPQEVVVMETTRNAGSCCGHHGATSAPAHRTAAPAPQGYTPVDQLHNEIDRLFGDFFGGFFSPWRAFSGMTPRSADNAPDMLIPHMDLSVTDTAYKATVELPGVAQDQVNIEVCDNMLIVEGEKKNETEDKDEKKGYYRMERSYGSFRRVLSLPEDVETDKITATHKDGVLSIEIPRKEPEKPATRKIEVVKGE